MSVRSLDMLASHHNITSVHYDIVAFSIPRLIQANKDYRDAEQRRYDEGKEGSATDRVILAKYPKLDSRPVSAMNPGKTPRYFVLRSTYGLERSLVTQDASSSSNSSILVSAIVEGFKTLLHAT
ncbi:hypothetical protein DPSP01_010056 [Paraphaeosphaeria sporulosa]